MMAQHSSFGHTQIPMTLICGFLGSGKTSLVNVILSVPIDLLRSQAWLCGIIDNPNTDVIRIKGLVRCPQYVEAVIVPGIHQWFDVRLGDDASKLQESMLVVIDRGLNREVMSQGWADCQITPEG